MGKERKSSKVNNNRKRERDIIKIAILHKTNKIFRRKKPKKKTEYIKIQKKCNFMR